MLRQQHRFFRSVLIASDTVVIAGSVVAAYGLRFGPLAPLFPPVPHEVRYGSHSIPLFVAVSLQLVTMLCLGLYQPRRDQRFYREAGDILKSVFVGVLFTFATVSFFRDVLFEGRDPSRAQYVVYAGVVTLALILWRYVFRVVLRYMRRRGWNLRHVAIIGTGRLGQVVGHTLSRNSWTGIKPSYFISHHQATKRDECMDLPVLGGLNDLESVLESSDVSGVFLALPGRMIAELPELLSRLSRFPVDVRIVPDTNPRFIPINMAINELEGMPVLSVRESPLSGWGRVVKRIFDVFGALTAILVFALPMIIITIAIRMTSGGPVIFRQERMSLNGRRFRIFKFRTMNEVDAEQQAVRDAGRGAEAWTQADDPRITRLGRLLRRTSLDELPQLFNVLIGEMSLVGPRPERPELIERFREDWRGYMLRQNVKAGITGWAQVNGLRGDTSLRKRLQYDMFYIRNWSIMFDVRILWMTLFRGFIHSNAG